MPGTFLHTDAGQDQTLLNGGGSGLFLGGSFGGLGGRPSNATANPFGALGSGNRPLGAGSGSGGVFSGSSAGGGGGGGTGGGFLKPSALGKRGKRNIM